MPDENQPTTEPVKSADPIGDYEKKVAELMSAPVPEGFVDPHIADLGGAPDADVNPQPPEESEGPRGLNDRIEAQIRDGERDEAGEEGTQGLPQEGEEQPEAPPAEEQPPAEHQPAILRDPVAEMAAQLRIQNPDLSIADALEIATARAPRLATEEQAPEAQPENDLPDPEAIEAHVEELDSKWRKMVRDLAPDEEVEAVEQQIKDAKKLIPQAREAAQARESRVAAEFQSVADQTLALYPDAGVEGTPLYARMEEIHETMERTGDDTINHPRKALLIAQMAARDLAIAPRTAGQKAPAQPARQTAPRVKGNAPMTAPLAPAAARAASPPQNKLSAEISATRGNPEAYNALLRKFGIRAAD